MAETKKFTPEEIAAEKEKARKTQLAILNTGVLKDLYVAAVNNLEEVPGKPDFGKEGANATYDFKYKSSLEAQAKNPDGNYARIMAMAALNAENQSQRRMSASYSARNLFEVAIPFYVSAIDSVKVSDMLGMMDVKKYDDIKDVANMYMGDLKGKNKELYGIISGIYLNSLVKIGTGEAIIASGKASRKGLEEILNQETKKKEAEKAAKEKK